MQSTPDGTDAGAVERDPQREPATAPSPAVRREQPAVPYPPAHWTSGYAPPGQTPWPQSYPPPPEYYRYGGYAPVPDSTLGGPSGQFPQTASPSPYPAAPAGPSAPWEPGSQRPGAPTTPRCQWCGMENQLRAERCERCGAMLPRAAVPGQVSLSGWPGAPGVGNPAPSPAGRVPVPVPARQRRANRSDAAVGTGATVIAAVSKFSLLAKFGIPLVSALASLGVYAALFGWQFGVGLLALLFVHEMGHAAVIRAKGIPASLPVFVPLLGAAVIMRRMPHNSRDEAEIAIAGPLVGGLAGAACFWVYTQTGSQLWIALAYFSFFLNLFNLIPVSPLDGGRVAGAVSKWVWPLGLVLIGVLFFYTQSFLLLIVGWLGLMQTISRFRNAAALDAYYRMPFASRMWITLLYFGLAAVLAFGMLYTQHLLIPGSSPFSY